MSLIGLPLSRGMLIGGALLVLTVMAEGGYIVGQAKRIGALEAANKNQAHQLAQSGLDLGVCLNTKQAVQEAHLQCMDEIRVTKDENAHQRESIEQLADHIRKESESVRREREVIYRQPGCQELRELDIAAVCPDLARSLRARAAAQVPTTGAGGGAGTGGPGPSDDR